MGLFTTAAATWVTTAARMTIARAVTTAAAIATAAAVTPARMDVCGAAIASKPSTPATVGPWAVVKPRAAPVYDSASAAPTGCHASSHADEHQGTKEDFA
jgi:hypothetical protein